MNRQARYLNGRFPSSYQSAVELAPVLVEIVGNISSVVDVGGGSGAWCKALKDYGVERVLCIDSPDIASQELLIDEDEFCACDLSCSFPDPVRFDLAICLELAEHLPYCRSQGLVEFLTESSNVVLFSAAIPGQAGAGHINLRPPEFWQLQFKEYSFQQWDVIRPRILSMSNIPFWYRQNVFIYAKEELKDQFSDIPCRYCEIPQEFEIVHKVVLDCYRRALQPPGLRALVREVPSAIKRALRSRLSNHRN